MDQSKNRAPNRFRKTPRKPGPTAMDSRSGTPTHSPTPNPFMGIPNIWEFSSFNPYLSMLHAGRPDGVKPYASPSPLPYTSSPTPFNDSISNYPIMDKLHQNTYAPLSRSRTSSFLPSDTSDSSRRGSDDYAPATRSFSSAAVERPVKTNNFGSYHYNNDGKPMLSRSTSSMSSKPIIQPPVSGLPSWALDSAGNVRVRSFARVLDSGELGKFITDKNGCQYLQDAFRRVLTIYQKHQIFDHVLGNKEDFIRYSTNMFGNFLVQQVIDMSMKSHDEEFMKRQEQIKEFIGAHMTELCLDKSACRVVQYALEHLDRTLACSLVQTLPRDYRLIAICVDQNANHVIQKVVSVIPITKWEFIINFVSQTEHLRQICSDKYGCRVIQTIIEKLTADSMNPDLTIVAQNQRERALRHLMNAVTQLCQELATNEYANYIIQHIVSCDDLAVYRECIIEKCLMRNLLSLSQEKFASHVVEKAFLKAPLDLLAEMMDEIFDGYVPHPETGKDALDIMMFHQFGNYVVQCMLTICCDAVAGRRETKEGSYDHMKSFHEWLKKLQIRISKERHRLSRFSSGKKMIDTLAHLRHLNPYFGLGSTGLQNFGFEDFSTASEDELENMDRKIVEKNMMMLQPRFGSASDELSPTGSHAHDGDDEAGNFSH